MKILIGSVFSGYCGKKKGRMALDIPGAGVLLAEEDKDYPPFNCVILNRDQLVSLRSAIDIELGTDHGRI